MTEEKIISERSNYVKTIEHMNNIISLNYCIENKNIIKICSLGKKLIIILLHLIDIIQYDIDVNTNVKSLAQCELKLIYYRKKTIKEYKECIKKYPEYVEKNERLRKAIEYNEEEIQDIFKKTEGKCNKSNYYTLKEFVKKNLKVLYNFKEKLENLYCDNCKEFIVFKYDLKQAIILLINQFEYEEAKFERNYYQNQVKIYGNKYLLDYEKSQKYFLILNKQEKYFNTDFRFNTVLYDYLCDSAKLFLNKDNIKSFSKCLERTFFNN